MVVSHRRKKGFTLIESAIVLGVTGAVVAILWVSIAAMTEQQRINQTRDIVVRVAMRMRTTLGVKTPMNTRYQMGSMSTLPDLAPSDLPVSSTNSAFIGNLWGVGSMNNNFYSTGVVTQQNSTRFGILITGVPRASCVDLLMRIPSADTGFLGATARRRTGSSTSTNGQILTFFNGTSLANTPSQLLAPSTVSASSPGLPSSFTLSGSNGTPSARAYCGAGNFSDILFVFTLDGVS